MGLFDLFKKKKNTEQPTTNTEPQVDVQGAALWHEQGETLKGQGDFAASYDAFSKAHEINPTRLLTMQRLAEVCYAQEKYEMCIDWCNQYGKLCKNDKVIELKNKAETAKKQAKERKAATSCKSSSQSLADSFSDIVVKTTRENSLPNPSCESFMNVGLFTQELFNYVKNNEYYEWRRDEEYFSSGYYTGIICSLLHAKDPSSLPQTGTLAYLKSICDMNSPKEYCCKLLSVETDSKMADEITNYMIPLLRALYEHPSHSDRPDNVYYMGLVAAFFLGDSVGQKYSSVLTANMQEDDDYTNDESKATEDNQIPATPAADKPECHIVNKSTDNKYALVRLDNRFFIAENTTGTPQIMLTPGGNQMETRYLYLGECLLEDVEKYGMQYMEADSIIPWHYAMTDNFCTKTHQEFEELLFNSFLDKPDWTFDVDDAAWKPVFGSQEERIDEIRVWLSNCTHMQMTAVYFIANAYHSINVAYVLALIMENHIDKARKKDFALLAELISNKLCCGPVENIAKIFDKFEVYYGIHLNTEGDIIEKPFARLPDLATDNTIHITTELLVGRNYYHYTDGEKDEEQPFVLHHDLSDLFSSEEDDDEDQNDEDDDETEDKGDLADWLPDDCWVKKISALDEEGEAYFIIALEVKDEKVIGMTLLRDDVQRSGGGFFFVPGMVMPGRHNYEEIDAEDYEGIKNEISALKKGRYLPDNFTFVGKKLPQKMIDDDKYNGDDTSYLTCLQSGYRLAYMDLSIDTDENQNVESYDYSTYQSTGSAYGDMFSRPHDLEDRNDEAIDMLLYIIDACTDEEYEELNKKNFD